MNLQYNQAISVTDGYYLWNAQLGENTTEHMKNDRYGKLAAAEPTMKNLNQ